MAVIPFPMPYPDAVALEKRERAQKRLDPRAGTKVCECATRISLHVHPNGEHWCDWCGGLAGKDQFKHVHRRGVCLCPSTCPKDAHISRRCR